MPQRATLVVSLVAIFVDGVVGVCPFANSGLAIPKNHPKMSDRQREALTEIDYRAVKREILGVLESSDESWPSDYNSYAPFFIRLAWHCAGSYRTSDGRGLTHFHNILLRTFAHPLSTCRGV